MNLFNQSLCVFVGVGSQAMPPPRKLPQRSWAASIPTILTHSKLHVLLLPSPMPCPVPGLAGSYLCSPLERFLGSVIMRRHLQRIIQLEPNVSQKQTCYSQINIIMLTRCICITLAYLLFTALYCELQRARRYHV